MLAAPRARQPKSRPTGTRATAWQWPGAATTSTTTTSPWPWANANCRRSLPWTRPPTCKILRSVNRNNGRNRAVKRDRYRGTTRYRYRTFKVSKYRLTTGSFLMLFLDNAANSSLCDSIAQTIFIQVRYNLYWLILYKLCACIYLWRYMMVVLRLQTYNIYISLPRPALMDDFISYKCSLLFRYIVVIIILLSCLWTTSVVVFAVTPLRIQPRLSLNTSEPSP